MFGQFNKSIVESLLLNADTVMVNFQDALSALITASVQVVVEAVPPRSLVRASGPEVSTVSMEASQAWAAPLSPR